MASQVLVYFRVLVLVTHSVFSTIRPWNISHDVLQLKTKGTYSIEHIRAGEKRGQSIYDDNKPVYVVFF